MDAHGRSFHGRASAVVATLLLATVGLTGRADRPLAAAPRGPATGAPGAVGVRATPAGAGRPNLVLIVSDDQTSETLPHTPPVMPYLEDRMADPADHWVRFSKAYINTPLCCPSRSSILTGLYSHHTGVETNGGGESLDESSTIATWLHAGGYRTAFFGKYLNLYPFNRGNYTPPGWDRWVAFKSPPNYYGYSLIEDGVKVSYGSTAADYDVDVLASKASAFIGTQTAAQPFFMVLAPFAPHIPSIPAPRYTDAFQGIAPTRLASFNEADVSDKPAWVQALPTMTTADVTKEDTDRRHQLETMLAMDDAVHAVIDALTAKGVLDNTVVMYLSDNGYAYGEHRWWGKPCEYEQCIHVPMLVRYPQASSHVDNRLVSNVDVAPTLAELAGVTPPLAEDGVSLVPALNGTATGWRTGLLIHWVGDPGTCVTGFWAIRTRDYLYAELTTGERELYDIKGDNGSADPQELDNRAGRPSYASVQAGLAAQLALLEGGGQHRGPSARGTPDVTEEGEGCR